MHRKIRGPFGRGKSSLSELYHHDILAGIRNAGVGFFSRCLKLNHLDVTSFSVMSWILDRGTKHSSGTRIWNQSITDIRHYREPSRRIYIFFEAKIHVREQRVLTNLRDSTLHPIVTRTGLIFPQGYSTLELLLDETSSAGFPELTILLHLKVKILQNAKNDL